ncbi:MAG TPA: hypothetical protein VFL96_05130, partial [Acidobacteriaceae bacterium]|nr:hypothetical protein [Acidobacteriaceae bacterium]
RKSVRAERGVGRKKVNAGATHANRNSAKNEACVAPALTFFLPTPRSARTDLRAEQIEVEI